MSVVVALFYFVFLNIDIIMFSIYVLLFTFFSSGGLALDKHGGMSQ